MQKVSKLADKRDVLDQKPWIGQFDPLDGVILHEAGPGAVAATA